MSSESPHAAAPRNLRELLKLATAPIREFMGEPLPERVGFLHTTGSLCLFMIILQVVTGVLMAFYYTPSPDVAWESIQYVEAKVAFGRIIHGLHHWGSSAFVVIIFIHMLRVFSYGAYKGMRKWTWLVGVGLLMTVLGFGFTGYLLPWDMKAYFGTQVGTNIMGKTPQIGPYLRKFMLGGDEISELTLPRFYAIHILILPAALFALAGAHLYLVRLYGITPPWKRDDEEVNYPTRFFPNQAARDSLMALGVLSLLLTLAAKVGADLEAKADPLNTYYAPHPEWYFLGLQQLLRYFQGPNEIYGTFIIPVGGILALALLPFIDFTKERKLSKRPVALSVAGIVVLSMITLTILGYRQLLVERTIKAEEEKKAALAAAQDDVKELAEQVKAASATVVNASAPSEPAGASHTPDPALAGEGENLYKTLKCADCHAGEGAGRETNIPPGLDFCGDRFTPDWMMTYLKEVPPRRYESKNRRAVVRMPDFKFSGRELESVTAYLMSLKKPDLVPAKVDPAKSTPEIIEQGRELFQSESCHVCHTLDGKGGKTAPDLTGAGSRLKPDFIFAMIKTPQSLVPDTTMENSQLQDPEIEALTQFLLSQK
ncbi:cytochrome b N-terminal domain-containing protein [Candidatus Sumerlaeota bacterium]|nr:cytochrome b N-terminal domain-containing protein [Candidatus Sumerlaeota bacterium]MBI3737310.1 cytochrome b N-terminal domain-containing protein [Candidatus Sumerlaeota bacterium]